MIVVADRVEERSNVKFRLQRLTSFIYGRSIRRPLVRFKREIKNRNMARLWANGLDLSQVFPDHKREVWVVKTKANKYQTVLCPQLVKQAAIEPLFIGLIVFAAIQNNALRPLPISMQPQNGAFVHAF
jgi:hypothetical protein